MVDLKGAICLAQDQANCSYISQIEPITEQISTLLKQVEYVVFLDNLLSIQVEVQPNENGELDWDAAERLAHSQFKQVLEEFVAQTPDTELLMYISDTIEMRDKYPNGTKISTNVLFYKCFSTLKNESYAIAIA